MSTRYTNPSALGDPTGLYSQIATAYPPLYFVAGHLPLADDGSVIGECERAAQVEVQCVVGSGEPSPARETENRT